MRRSHSIPRRSRQFNKKFELLADDIRDNREKGYTTCLLTENKAQIERLRNIFNSMGERDVPFEAVGRYAARRFYRPRLAVLFLYRPPAFRPVPPLPDPRRDRPQRKPHDPGT